MGDVVGAVALLHILDNAVAAFVVEVHVDIGHTHALRVQETLEEQAIFEWIQVGNAQAIGNNASGGGASSRPHRHAVSLGPVDKVLDDEEVVGEAHSGDGLELEIKLLGHVIPKRRTVALFGTLVHQMAEVGHGLVELSAPFFTAHHVAVVVTHLFISALLNNVRILCQMAVDVGKEFLRQLESREHVAAVDFYRLNLFQHLYRVGQGLGMCWEECCHLVFALEVLLLSVAETVDVGHIGVGGETDEAVVRGTVFPTDKVHVVGGNHLHSVPCRHFEDGLVVGLLALVEGFHLGLGLGRQAFHGAAVEHHFQVIVFPEDALEPFDGLFGVFRRAVDSEDILGDLAGHAGAAADEPFVVFFQQGVVDTGLVVETLDVAKRHQLHEIVIAGLVLGQEDEMVVFTVLRVFERVVVMPRHIDLAAENRFYQRMLFGGVVELLHTVHVAMVGDGQAGHAEFLRPLEELFNIGKPVEDGVLGVDVEMYERHAAYWFLVSLNPSCKPLASASRALTALVSTNLPATVIALFMNSRNLSALHRIWQPPGVTATVPSMVR